MDFIFPALCENLFCFSFGIYLFSFFKIKAKSDNLSPLLRYFPTRAAPPAGKIFFPNSPCPSPTPVFQQLYMALAHFDRLPAEVVRSLLKPGEGKVASRSNSFSVNEEQSPSLPRRQSYPVGKPSMRISSHDDKS